MKKIRILTCLIILTGLFQFSFAQKNVAESLGRSVMPIGAYYYPEHWNSDEWAPDLKKMSELGFEFTHFGEFSWAMLEPEEGKFEFQWLDSVVNLAHNNGLSVIMCTPTPTPPAWLTEKHPEILSVNEDLYKQEHGGRLHVIYDHPVYQKYAKEIITRMAERYGNHPAVAGWQLDNEPHFRPIYDYSEFARQLFPKWLKEKYGTIDTLNHAWGTAFWSQTYNNFGQITLPNKNTGNTNPHAQLDFMRFTADRLANGLRFQAELLDELISDKQWITTNYAYYKFLPATDPFRNRDDLDFASHTMYLTSGVLSNEGGPLAHRLGSGLELAFSNELAKSVNGKTGIMELQPGQINWGTINPQPLPGAVRMWVWHSFGLGDKFICTYRFKQPLFGSEQTHKGIIDTDGKTIARGGKEYVQAIEEISSLPEKNVEIPADITGKRTALMWNLENIADIENHRHHADFNAWQHVYDYYAALKSMGCPVHFMTESDMFDPEKFPFMVVPAYQIVSEKLVQKWETYVQRGGNLIISSRTAKKDPNGHLWKAHNQHPIWDLIGAEITEFDHLPAQYPGTIKMNDETFEWYRWGDWLKPGEGTEILASYNDQFYKGTPAVVTRKTAKGTVTYIGAWSNNGKLEKKVLRTVYGADEKELPDLPPYVFIEWRDGYFVAVNYSSKTATISVPGDAKILYGETTLNPGNVLVWK